MRNEGLQSMMEQFAEYIRAVWRRKWTIVLSWSALTAAAIVWIAVMPDYFRSTTTILVDPQKVPEDYVAATIKSSMTERLQTITQEVLSATRLQEVIDRWRLYEDLRGSLGREEIIEIMRKDLKIEVKPAAGAGPGAFTITYQGRDPVVVAQVTNELASRFIDWNLKSREQLAVSTTEFLNDELQRAKRDLEVQEEQIREFKMKYLGQMPEHLPANLGALAQGRTAYQANADALNRLEQERMQLLRLPEMERPGKRPVVLGERARLEQEKLELETTLFELRKRYTDVHPGVIQVSSRLNRIKEQLQQMPPPSAEAPEPPTLSQVRLEIIAKDMKRIEEEQKRLTTQMTTYQARVDAVPVREQQLADLARDYEISKQKYRSLLEKKFSAEMAADLERKQKAERFTILDPARPAERPFKPQRQILMILSAIASLAISVVGVILNERTDHTVKSERELPEIFGAPITLLATIPSVEIKSDRRRRLRNALLAASTSLALGLGVAAFLWKVRPYI